MDQIVSRYYELKQKQKEIEQELAALKSGILSHCTERDVSELEAGGFRVKVVHQERKEYDDKKLYEALPDPEVWRLISRADTAKIASLIKIGVIPEETVKDTYTIKTVSLLHVDKK